VVNNAIVLLTYVNQLKATGMPRREALVKGMRTRLRPILMTSMTTAFGMLPLALGLGSGAEFYSPLAIAVIGGLSASTIGSLLIIPVLDSLAEQFGEFILRSFRRLGLAVETAFTRRPSQQRSEDLQD
jgi:HAE1 family hydrophobic/amphiphilic exporter-1